MALLMLGIVLLGGLWEILIAILDDSGHRNARGKGRHPEKYVTR